MTMRFPVLNNPAPVEEVEEAPKSILEEIAEAMTEEETVTKLLEQVDDDPILRQLVQWINASKDWRRKHDEASKRYYEATYEEQEKIRAELARLNAEHREIDQLRPRLDRDYKIYLKDGRRAQVMCNCGKPGACDLSGKGGYRFVR